MPCFNRLKPGHPSINLPAESHLASAAEERSCSLDQPVSLWSLDTPPLRDGVVSLEHWLDLNA